MKKHLVLALAALALVACGNSGTPTNTPSTPAETPTTAAPTTAAPTTAPVASTVTIDQNDQTELKAACNGAVYHSADVEFTSDGATWVYSPDFGLAGSNNAEYQARNVFQVKKSTGKLYNTTALPGGYTKATIKYYATYASQDGAGRFLTVNQGLSANPTTAAPAVESFPLSGTDAGFIGSGTYQAYEYTVTYTLDAAATYFSFDASTQNAVYLISIVLE